MLDCACPVGAESLAEDLQKIRAYRFAGFEHQCIAVQQVADDKH